VYKGDNVWSLERLNYAIKNVIFEFKPFSLERGGRQTNFWIQQCQIHTDYPYFSQRGRKQIISLTGAISGRTGGRLDLQKEAVIV
jgi:hypothetical protein